MVKNLPANAGDPSSIPGLGRSPGEGNGNSLQYPCLGNPTDRSLVDCKELDMTEQLNSKWQTTGNLGPCPPWGRKANPLLQTQREGRTVASCPLAGFSPFQFDDQTSMWLRFCSIILTKISVTYNTQVSCLILIAFPRSVIN